MNVLLFSYSVADLPPRDPHEPLNQTKHLLAWLEFGGIWSIVLLFFLTRALNSFGEKLGISVLETVQGETDPKSCKLLSSRAVANR